MLCQLLCGQCPMQFRCSQGHLAISFVAHLLPYPYVVVEGKTIPFSIQMVNYKTPCRSNRTLESLLRVEGMFWPKIPCCSQGVSKVPFALILLSWHWQVQWRICATWVILQSQNLWAMFSINSTQHMGQLSLTFATNIVLGVNFNCFVPNWPNEGLSFILQIFSTCFPIPT